jgi:uncharacterized protein (TIGR00369 family)
VTDPTPLHALLDVRTTMPGNGTATAELPYGDYVRGWVSPLHGGIVATIVDIACAATLVGKFDPAEEVPVSTDLHVRYYRTPKQWPVRATGRLVHAGRTLLGTECVVTDAGGAELARASATYVIVRGFNRDDRGA